MAGKCRVIRLKVSEWMACPKNHLHLCSMRRQKHDRLRPTDLTRCYCYTIQGIDQGEGWGQKTFCTFHLGICIHLLHSSYYYYPVVQWWRSLSRTSLGPCIFDNMCSFCIHPPFELESRWNRRPFFRSVWLDCLPTEVPTADRRSVDGGWRRRQRLLSR